MRPKIVSDSDLLKIACQCFVEHGPQVSTMAIATAAGVSQATLFKRFKNKDQLMARALTHESPILLQHIEPPDPNRCIRQQLRGICTFMMSFFRVAVPRFMVIAAAGSNTPAKLFGGESGPPAMVRRALTTWLEQAVQQEQLRDFDAQSVAVALIGMMQTRPFRELALGDQSLPHSDEEYVDAIIDVIWSGIAPREDQ